MSHDSNMAVTGATTTLKLGDVEYKMSPLTDRDIVELDEWVRDRYIRTARRSCEGCSQEEREFTMRIALEAASTLTWMSGLGAKTIATVDGMTRLMWQSIKANHPQVTEDSLRSHLFNPENLEAVIRKFNEMNNRNRKQNPPKGTRRPKAKRR